MPCEILHLFGTAWFIKLSCPQKYVFKPSFCHKMSFYIIQAKENMERMQKIFSKCCVSSYLQQRFSVVRHWLMQTKRFVIIILALIILVLLGVRQLNCLIKLYNPVCVKSKMQCLDSWNRKATKKNILFFAWYCVYRCVCLYCLVMEVSLLLSFLASVPSEKILHWAKCLFCCTLSACNCATMRWSIPQAVKHSKR